MVLIKTQTWSLWKDRCSGPDEKYKTLHYKRHMQWSWWKAQTLSLSKTNAVVLMKNTNLIIIKDRCSGPDENTNLIIIKDRCSSPDKNTNLIIIKDRCSGPDKSTNLIIIKDRCSGPDHSCGNVEFQRGRQHLTKIVSQNGNNLDYNPLHLLFQNGKRWF